MIASLLALALIHATPVPPPPSRPDGGISGSRPSPVRAAPGAPANSPPTNLPPIPTGEACPLLPVPKQPLTLPAWETLDYDIDAMGAKAGKMTIKLLPVKNGVLTTEIDVETNTFFSKIRKVNGVGKSSLDAKTLRPSRYLEDAMENGVHRVAEVTFKAPRVHLESTIDGQTRTVDFPYRDTLDLVGTLTLLRQVPLTVGQPVCFDSYGIRSVWRVWGTVVGKEHVNLPVGEFDALHIAGTAARLDIPSVRREIHLYLSDDALHLPLAALGSIDLGTVRATLTGIARPDQKLKAENKANLKW